MGASQALASMVTEEEERLAREQKERFPVSDLKCMWS